jgi:Mg-chelatase subunit ChlD
MCSAKRTRRIDGPRRGAAIVLFCVLLVALMALLALSLDLGYISAVKADLQGAVDAGALAGSGTLLEGKGKAANTAQRFAELNLDSSGSVKQKVEVQTGHWDTQSRLFVPGGEPLDAVKVIARVDNASLFFGRAVGTSRFSTEASAVAVYRPRDIVLVLDVSGSMSESRNGVKKIDELRNAVRFFLSYLRKAKGKDRVGFTYYSTTAEVGSSLSFDLNKVEREMLDHLRPGGWTNIADGMQLALDEFSRNGRDNVLPLIVLLTDGAANMNQPGNRYDPAEAKGRVIQRAHEARRQKIPIFTMALDSRTSEIDVDLMRRVADITDSESYHILA